MISQAADVSQRVNGMFFRTHSYKFYSILQPLMSAIPNLEQTPHLMTLRYRRTSHARAHAHAKAFSFQENIAQLSIREHVRQPFPFRICTFTHMHREFVWFQKSQSIRDIWAAIEMLESKRHGSVHPSFWHKNPVPYVVTKWFDLEIRNLEQTY